MRSPGPSAATLLTGWIDQRMNISNPRQNDLRLTPREHQLAVWLESDLTYEEIADRLGNGLETVRTQVKTLFYKLGVNTRHAAVARLIRSEFTRTGDGHMRYDGSQKRGGLVPPKPEQLQNPKAP